MLWWIFGIVLLVGLLLVVVGVQLDRDKTGMSGMMMAILSALIGGTCLLVAGGNKIYIGQQFADVASLRESAARVDLQTSEDIYGKVADFNRELARIQWANRRWWEDPFIPDEWDTVSVIPIRQKESKGDR